MNRRKAIFRISLAGAGVGAAFAGYKWYDITKSPDIAYLDKSREFIAALAETIIPATDTPGAKETGVHDFIIMMVKECTERKAQNKFINGLKDLQEYCNYEHGKPYQECPSQQQESVLMRFEKKDKPYNGLLGKAQVRFLGKSFFATLKEYTVEGYCTSEAGATKGLAYLPVPGNYSGCTTLEQGQKAWAL
ncbi:MAG: gluconate 2-dehydrogenase subunit 3 family protein [Chitinophagaceae bacterium]